MRIKGFMGYFCLGHTHLFPNFNYTQPPKENEWIMSWPHLEMFNPKSIPYSKLTPKLLFFTLGSGGGFQEAPRKAFILCKPPINPLSGVWHVRKSMNSIFISLSDIVDKVYLQGHCDCMRCSTNW